MAADTGRLIKNSSARASKLRRRTPDRTRVALACHSAPPNRLAWSRAHTLSTAAYSHCTRARAEATHHSFSVRTRTRRCVENINNSTARPTAADQTELSRVSVYRRRRPPHPGGARVDCTRQFQMFRNIFRTLTRHI